MSVREHHNVPESATPEPPAPLLSCEDLVGLLAERDRLRVVAALVLGADDLPGIRTLTGLEYPMIAKALGRLGDGGLVEELPDHRYVALGEAFALAARAAAQRSTVADAAPEFDPGRVSEADAKVLRTFLRDGRLVRIPAQQSKRLVILEHLAQQFEPGVHYAERTVNTILARFHPDTAALRRYLVDHGLLDRADGEYWRSGGRVD